MADDRFTYLHVQPAVVPLLGTDDDDFEVDLPDEEINVPHHLMPRYQDEDDQSILPTNTHPSYPFGNPYRAAAKNTFNKGDPFRNMRSLATNLPALLLPQGLPASSLQWSDLALDQLLPPKELEGPAAIVMNSQAADQVTREGEEAQHRAANGPPPEEEEGAEENSDREST